MKRFKKLTLALILTLIGSLFIGFTPAQAADSDGVWVLVGHEFNISEPKFDDGSPYNSNFYIEKYDYDESKNEAYFEKKAVLNNIDGHFECNMFGTCRALTTVAGPDDDIKFESISWVTGSNMDGLSYGNNMVVNWKGFIIYWRDINDYDHCYISSGTGVDPVSKDSAIVAYSLGKGKEYGEQVKVAASQSHGNVDRGEIECCFIYEWRASAPSIEAPGKVTIKSASTGTNKVTVKIKKISKNCKGYEFEIATKKDFSDAKTYTVNKNKTIKKTISGLDEDVIYYIRVRAFNSKDGQKAYGAYSKTKKIVL